MTALRGRYRRLCAELVELGRCLGLIQYAALTHHPRHARTGREPR